MTSDGSDRRLPVGLWAATVPAILVDYWIRFRCVGLSKSASLSLALSRSNRALLDEANVDLVRPHLLQLGDAVVVDVGANVGCWSEAVLRFISPSRLFAFEPSQRSFGVLASRLSAWPQAVPLRIALAEEGGEAHLYQFEEAAFDSLHRPLPDLQARYGVTALSERERVTVSTLDRALEEQGVEEEIAVLKIDVQGGELSVLKGASNSLDRTRCVVLEVLFQPHYEGEVLYWDLHEHMTRAGFMLHRFIKLRHDSAGALVWADALYLKSEDAGANAP